MRFGANVASYLMILQGSRQVLALSPRSIISPRTTPLAAAASSTLIRMASSSTSEAATMVATNPMLEQDGLPKFKSIEASHLTPAVEELLQKLEKDFSGLEENLSSKNGAVDFD